MRRTCSVVFSRSFRSSHSTQSWVIDQQVETADEWSNTMSRLGMGSSLIRVEARRLCKFRPRSIRIRGHAKLANKLSPPIESNVEEDRDVGKLSDSRIPKNTIRNLRKLLTRCSVSLRTESLFPTCASTRQMFETITSVLGGGSKNFVFRTKDSNPNQGVWTRSTRSHL